MMKRESEMNKIRINELTESVADMKAKLKHISSLESKVKKKVCK